MKEIAGYWWPDDVGEKYKASLKRINSLFRAITICRHKVRLGTAIQAGGSMGIWPKLLAANFETVYTFEPDPISFECLCRNVPEYNVFKLPAALGGIRGCVSLRRESLTNHKVDTSNGGHIPMIRVDDLWLRKCDAILLDVEGFEFQALGGAGQTIQQCRPAVVLVEAREKVQGSNNIDMVDQLLCNHRYHLLVSLDGDDIYEADK
jgi:FkbM family methyltransferase